MIISLIVAMEKNRVIGVNNQLPWHLPHDLQHFKATTLGKTIIMGRKTFESIGKPLPKRRNIVLSRKADFASPGIDVFHDLKAALDACRDEAEVMIIGGATLYAEALPLANKLYLTRVDADVEGDAFFPEVDWEKWALLEERKHPKDDQHCYSFTIQIYLRLDHPPRSLPSAPSPAVGI